MCIVQGPRIHRGGEGGVMMIDDKQWHEETLKRIGEVAEFFKPKEVQVLMDFVNTAKDCGERRAEKKEPAP